MRIPGADLAAQHAALRDELNTALMRVIDSGSFVLGGEVTAFEHEFAGFCEVEHALGVANGTDALELAVKALHLNADDAVALPAFTFAATAEAVCLAGARPVLVDIDPATFNLDPAALRRTLRTQPGIRAVIVVHLYGRPAPMDEINDIAAESGIKVIEDAAQAHGARYRDRPVGGLGRIGCFSFYPTKNLGAAGDAGAVTTTDVGLAARLAMLRDHGQREKYLHTIVGHNSRLDALQAAVLRVKLPHVARWNARRREVAQLYRSHLDGARGIVLPGDDEGAVYHLFTIRCSDRDGLSEELARRGIASAIHYPRTLAQQRAFAFLRHEAGDFPYAEAAAREVLSLPCYPEISDEAVREVAAAVKEWASSH